ncbi:MAG: ABC transporter permease DevC [Crocosphaera sp.]
MKIPLAWLQLSREPLRLLVALAGIGFADILMFMQLGFKEALFESNTRIHGNLLADIVIISSQSKALHDLKSFPRRRLYQSLSLEEVESIAPAYIYGGPWKNPETGKERIILVVGFNPSQPVLNFPEVNQQLDQLKLGNTVLFDRVSRPEFGPIVDLFGEGNTVKTELNGQEVRVGGLITVGASFAADGNVIVSAETWLRLFPNRDRNDISLGVIRLKSGTDTEEVRQKLLTIMPNDINILTRQEFVDLEKNYWATATPIGFIFIIGTIMGFFVGIIIVYQVLYTDVSNHLPEYATLKAIGYSQNYLLGVVFQSALILALLGFIPGLGISLGLYGLTKNATQLPITMTVSRSVSVLILTISMCAFSGVLTVRRLQDADPADIF